MNEDSHYYFMALALKLASKGSEQTKPNPKVGALLVKDGEVVGKGYHSKAGENHAEVIAIKEAGQKANGATLYITLEPCSHHAKTPPCVDLIIKSGIQEVVVACKDPNPNVNGGGLNALKANNIRVIEDVLSAQAIELNKGFFSRMSHGRPYVRSKIATSIDGRTSLKSGDSKWITSDFARKDVQQWRKNACAIITGVNTINRDNPKLNVRLNETNYQPYRAILDTHLSIDLHAQILKQNKVILAYAEDPDGKINILKKMKVHCLRLPIYDNFVDLNQLMKELTKLECNDILVESGPTLNGRLLEQNLIDELIFYMAPIIMGGGANPIFNNPILSTMQEKIQIEQKDVRYFGDNLRLIMKVLPDQCG